ESNNGERDEAKWSPAAALHFLMLAQKTAEHDDGAERNEAPEKEPGHISRPHPGRGSHAVLAPEPQAKGADPEEDNAREEILRNQKTHRNRHRRLEQELQFQFSACCLIWKGGRSRASLSMCGTLAKVCPPKAFSE